MNNSKVIVFDFHLLEYEILRIKEDLLEQKNRLFLFCLFTFKLRYSITYLSTYMLRRICPPAPNNCIELQTEFDWAINYIAAIPKAGICVHCKYSKTKSEFDFRLISSDSLTCPVQGNYILVHIYFPAFPFY